MFEWQSSAAKVSLQQPRNCKREQETVKESKFHPSSDFEVVGTNCNKHMKHNYQPYEEQNVRWNDAIACKLWSLALY